MHHPSQLRFMARFFLLALLTLELVSPPTAQAQDEIPPHVDCHNYLIAKPLTLPYSSELLALYRALPVALSDETLKNLATSIARFQRHVIRRSLLRGRPKLVPDWDAKARMISPTAIFLDDQKPVLWAIQEFKIGSGGTRGEFQQLIQSFSLATGLPQSEMPEELSDEQYLSAMLEMRSVGTGIPRLRDPAFIKNGILSVLNEDRLLVIQLPNPQGQSATDHVLFDGFMQPGVHIVRQMELIDKDDRVSLTLLSNGRVVRARIKN